MHTRDTDRPGGTDHGGGHGAGPSVLTASAAPVRFGARLTNDTQPQPALWCDEPNETPPHADCTWILNEAHQRNGGGHQGTEGRAPSAAFG